MIELGRAAESLPLVLPCNDTAAPQGARSRWDGPGAPDGVYPWTRFCCEDMVCKSPTCPSAPVKEGCHRPNGGKIIHEYQLVGVMSACGQARGPRRLRAFAEVSLNPEIEDSYPHYRRRRLYRGPHARGGSRGRAFGSRHRLAGQLVRREPAPDPDADRVGLPVAEAELKALRANEAP